MNRTEPTPINSFGLPNIVIPAEVLFNPNLSQSEKMLFGFVNNLAYNEKGYCWATNAYFGKMMGVRADTISVLLGNLQSGGYLKLEYLTNTNGMQSRQIYIDKSYLHKFDKILKDKYTELNTNQKMKKPGRPRLGDTPKPPLVKSKTPPCETPSNIDIDIEKDLKHSLSEEKSSDGVCMKRTKHPSNNGKPSIKERNKEILPIARRLSQIIRQTEDMKHTGKQITGWTNEIRKLIEGNGISQGRISKALDWYEINIGRTYTPVIKCASSLRNKFLNLENAMNRKPGGNGNGNKPETPDCLRAEPGKYDNIPTTKMDPTDYLTLSKEV